MSEEKRGRNISMDDLTRKVSNMNISSGLSGLSPEEFERLKKDKIAIITIGRWQPPHAGHLELIDGTYQKVIKFQKAGFKGADGYIWIAPRPDKKIGNFINKNPLYLIDKWIYLNYMLPFDRYGDKLKFLHTTNIDNDINQKVFRGYGPNNASFLTAKHNLRENVIEDQLSESQAIKYNLLFKYGKENYQKFKQRTVKVNVRNQRGSASATCIEFLKNRGYKKLLLLVGSDRVEAFQAHNQTHLENAFGHGNGLIEQIGADRGTAGEGLLFDLGLESGDESEANLAEEVMNYCSIQGCEQKAVEEKSRERSTSIAGTYSGTRIRECAYTLENLDYFCEGTIIGGMTKELSFCLLNDLRKRHKPSLDPITKSVWNEKVSSDYQFLFENIKHDELYSRLSLAQHGFFGRGGRKRKTRRKKGKGTIFSRRRNRENTSNVGKGLLDLVTGALFTIIKEENGNVFFMENSSGSGGIDDRNQVFGPFSLRAIEESQDYVVLEKSDANADVVGRLLAERRELDTKVSPGGTQSGGRRKTRKRGRVPIKYVPKSLTKKDKKKARKELKKSRKAYKKGKYYPRKKVKSFKSKKSNHIINAMKIYGVKSVSASPKLAKKSGCSVTGLKKLVSKGAGAYYSSGSRPNQTAISWGRARMASAITGGKAAAVDFKILEKYCKPSSKALKLAKQAKKKHGYGTRKVRKVKL